MDGGQADRRRGLEEVEGAVYGTRVRGLLPEAFRRYLLTPAGDGAGSAAPLELRYRTLEELPEVEEIWASEAEGPGGRDRFALFRIPGGFGLTVSSLGWGLFRCTPRRIEIAWAPGGTGAAHCLVSYALPLWLESEGVPVLHGSAVSIGGRAVAFLGRTGVGKSVLCAELLGAGCGFLADDAVALRRDAGGGWCAYPGPPLLRLWPSGLEERLGVAPGTLPRVHETLEKRWMGVEAGGVDPFAGVRLAAVYVLERRPESDGSPRIAGWTARDGLVQLLEHGVAAGPAAALEFSGRRLRVLAEVAEEVPVRRLRFPGGPGSAERVREAIGRDLE